MKRLIHNNRGVALITVVCMFLVIATFAAGVITYSTIARVGANTDERRSEAYYYAYAAAEAVAYEIYDEIRTNDLVAKAMYDGTTYSGFYYFPTTGSGEYTHTMKFGFNAVPGDASSAAIIVDVSVRVEHEVIGNTHNIYVTATPMTKTSGAFSMPINEGLPSMAAFAFSVDITAAPPPPETPMDGAIIIQAGGRIIFDGGLYNFPPRDLTYRNATINNSTFVSNGNSINVVHPVSMPSVPASGTATITYADNYDWPTGDPRASTFSHYGLAHPLSGESMNYFRFGSLTVAATPPDLATGESKHHPSIIAEPAAYTPSPDLPAPMYPPERPPGVFVAEGAGYIRQCGGSINNAACVMSFADGGGHVCANLFDMLTYLGTKFSTGEDMMRFILDSASGTDFTVLSNSYNNGWYTGSPQLRYEATYDDNTKKLGYFLKWHPEFLEGFITPPSIPEYRIGGSIRYSYYYDADTDNYCYKHNPNGSCAECASKGIASAPGIGAFSDNPNDRRYGELFTIRSLNHATGARNVDNTGLLWKNAGRDPESYDWATGDFVSGVNAFTRSGGSILSADGNTWETLSSGVTITNGQPLDYGDSVHTYHWNVLHSRAIEIGSKIRGQSLTPRNPNFNVGTGNASDNAIYGNAFARAWYEYNAGTWWTDNTGNHGSGLDVWSGQWRMDIMQGFRDAVASRGMSNAYTASVDNVMAQFFDYGFDTLFITAEPVMLEYSTSGGSTNWHSGFPAGLGTCICGLNTQHWALYTGNGDTGFWQVNDGNHPSTPDYIRTYATDNSTWSTFSDVNYQAPYVEEWLSYRNAGGSDLVLYLDDVIKIPPGKQLTIVVYNMTMQNGSSQGGLHLMNNAGFERTTAQSMSVGGVSLSVNSSVNILIRQPNEHMLQSTAVGGTNLIIHEKFKTNMDCPVYVIAPEGIVYNNTGRWENVFYGSFYSKYIKNNGGSVVISYVQRLRKVPHLYFAGVSTPAPTTPCPVCGCMCDHRCRTVGPSCSCGHDCRSLVQTQWNTGLGGPVMIFPRP